MKKVNFALMVAAAMAFAIPTASTAKQVRHGHVGDYLEHTNVPAGSGFVPAMVVHMGGHTTVVKVGEQGLTKRIYGRHRLATGWAEETFGKALPVRIDPADSIQREEPVEEEPDDCDSDACSGDDEPKGGKKGGGKR